MTPTNTAHELIELIKSEMDALDDVGKRIIANRLIKLLEPYQPIATYTPVAFTEPFNDGEAKFYGGQKMPFGKYTGARVDCVPLDYLIWLADESRKTWKGLHRYLNSPRIKQELENE